MAHFAEIDENNVVLRVIVVSNSELLVDNVENEEKGINFCKSLFGENTRWVQTSYNNSFRKQHASVGSTYDFVKNKFILSQPYSSWILNQNDDWKAPVPCPETYTLGLKNENNEPIKDPYRWDESTLQWVLIDNQT
jgi:hypothetical protein